MQGKSDSSANAIVRFRKVDKSFGDVHVLRSLDFEANRGEKVTIIGPSGSGKTTILRVLMTLEKPDSGVIYVEGEPLWHKEVGGKLVEADEKHLREMRKKIGMVFQQFNLFPHMKVLRNVTEAPIHVLGKNRAEAEAHAKELLDMVGLSDKVDSYPYQLSGGQKQRVAIARALAMQPKVMLFDEVTAALDPELVTEVLGVMRQLARDTDMTMLIVTHEMWFARDVSDRVIFFNEGQVWEESPPDILFTNPKRQRTREFLSSVLRENESA